MQGDPPRSQRAQQVVSTRTVEVVRIVVGTAPVDPDYARVELEIDGELYEMDRPSAQALGGAIAHAAGAAPIDAHDDETERRLLSRLEREQLLAHGLTAEKARLALDA